uniref:Uncharacterized protein n=1 Tax=Amphimedon queenslandica TaxID=400682 RepID=A0A1X7V4K5_AMPQE
MTAIAGPLHLISRSGTRDLYNTTDSISSGDCYTQASVIASDPKSLWVVYTVPNWDHGNSPDSNSATIVEPDGTTVSTMSPIQSAQGFNMENPGAILFEHSKFRGYGNQHRSHNEDLTSSFSQGTIAGVSSAIITGGVWNLFTGINFTGKRLVFDGKQDLGPGRYDFGCLPANDQAKSIKYVRPA